jgi:hypothetical protein
MVYRLTGVIRCIRLDKRLEEEAHVTSARLYRLSGFALVIGMILSAVSSIGSGLAFPDTTNPAAATNPLSVLLSLLGVIGTIVALLGLPGMYARAAREGGLVWLVGVVLIAITGILFGVFLGLMGALVFPVLAAQAPDLFREGPPPSFFGLFIVGTLANVVGAFLMAIPMITKRIYPRWCGYMLIAAAVLGVVSFITNGPGPSSLIGQILNVVSPLPLFLVLGWAGFELWSGKAPASEMLASSVLAQPA